MKFQLKWTSFRGSSRPINYAREVALPIRRYVSVGWSNKVENGLNRTGICMFIIDLSRNIWPKMNLKRVIGSFLYGPRLPKMAVIENCHFRVTGSSNRLGIAESYSEGTSLLLTCQGTYGLKLIFFELFGFKVLPNYYT